ncbi:MAG: ATP synthase F1 subunit delta [Candidatus Aminicenantes bacterium]|nr:MAG: ATP synthase F1 subunit delta [Candidatus Aminicenantes bacterium]
MRNQVLIRRYAQGLINSARTREEFDSLCLELSAFDKFLASQPKLQDTLQSPFLPATKKKEIAAQILERFSTGNKSKRFLLLLVENGRLLLLPEILEYLPVLWNEEQGISTFEVSSVIPLNQDQKKRLEEKLVLLEQRPVALSYKMDRSLIGGLSIRKGNIVYDASIQGDLERLKQKIAEE